MTADPNELLAEIVTLAAERAVLHDKIDADLDTLPADPSEEAIGAHLERRAEEYRQLLLLGGKIGEAVDDLAQRDVLAEIGAFLAITYGGRA